MMELINKIFIFLYILCCLNVTRNFYYFIRAWVKVNSPEYDDEEVNFFLTDKQKWYLAISIAYILTGIIAGITF